MTTPKNPQRMDYPKLVRLCEVLHALLYSDGESEAARRYLPDLWSLLDSLPPDDMSIVGAEGRALYYELTGDIGKALTWRRREVELMLLLYEDIRKNNYDKDTKKALLGKRDKTVLTKRRAIIKSLRQALSQ
jgi:hypothetical protein